MSGTSMNPKVGASCDPVDSWYRYYAGYSAGFVEKALKEWAATTELVLDPWNGTGTTTVVAASKNVPAIGFDVNPALVVVSRARLLGAGVWASIDPLGEDVVAHRLALSWTTTRSGSGSANRRPAGFVGYSRACTGSLSTAAPPRSRLTRVRRE